MGVPDLKLLIHYCFRVMMTNGMLNSQNSLFGGLNSVAFFLKNAFDLSDKEIHQALVYFFDEYNKGCTTPMTSAHINQNVIPAVLAHKEIDITLAAQIVDTAIDIIMEHEQ